MKRMLREWQLVLPLALFFVVFVVPFLSNIQSV